MFTDAGNAVDFDQLRRDGKPFIDSFRGEYDILSNFYPAPIEFDGLHYLSNEAAFQAQKTLNLEVRAQFCTLTPEKAKRMGRQVALREDWEEVKVELMYRIVCAKFTQHAELTRRLLDTHDIPLYEGNTWNDCFWGVCRGRGRNELGKILMRVREELRDAF